MQIVFDQFFLIFKCCYGMQLKHNFFLYCFRPSTPSPGLSTATTTKIWWNKWGLLPLEPILLLWSGWHFRDTVLWSSISPTKPRPRDPTSQNIVPPMAIRRDRRWEDWDNHCLALRWSKHVCLSNLLGVTMKYQECITYIALFWGIYPPENGVSGQYQF
jgi:hypothetical protein